MKKHPDRWQDCKPFVDTLVDKHQYAVRVKLLGEESSVHVPSTSVKLQLCMADGMYLYMYELWQDGVEYGSTVMRRVVTRLKHRAIRSKRVIKRTRRKKR